MDRYSAFLHTDAWKHLQEATGLEVQTLGGFAYIKRHIPQGCYWQSSRCDIHDSWTIPDFTQSAWFLRLEPADDTSFACLQKKHRLIPTIAFQPRQTSVVNLSLSEEDILAHMKQKHRYNIKVAEKHGVTISLYHTDITRELPRFLRLLQQTADRHDFHTHDATYYTRMVEILEPEHMVHVAIASYKGVDIAGALVITHGSVATYLHGGSTHDHREVMAPYRMHWEIMRWAKNCGCTAYDLWGTHAIQNAQSEWVSQESHASAGTTRFKLGFGGEIISYPGTFDLVLKPVQYRIYTAIRALRSRKRAFT